MNKLPEFLLKPLVFLIAITLLFSSCSPQKKLMGEWRWVTYEITPTKEKIPSERTLERIRKLHKFYSTNYFQSIGLLFKDSGIYEHYAARGVNWGKYYLKGKNLRLSEVFLSHKKNTLYKIKKINKKEMWLVGNKATMIFERDMDPEYEAARNEEPADMDGHWSNARKRGQFDELIVFDFIQTGSMLEGTVSFPERRDTVKNTVLYNFKGQVTGNFAKIFVLKIAEGAVKYSAKTYELRFELENGTLSVVFVRQRYLDKDGKLVKFLGDIDSPFPRKMTLTN